MASVVANPGNLVIPLSAVIDQLQGKLSAADLNALLLTIVSKQKSEVRPGDLITADLMNQLIADIANLNLRVATLEAGVISVGDGAIITGISPTANIHVGDRLTVQGQNFNVPTINNDVFVNQVKITAFALSGSSTQFSFDIPDVGVSAQSPPAILKVSNGNGSPAVFAFQLLPLQQVPSGRVEVSYASAPIMPLGSPNITIGQQYVFTFQIKALADLAGNYQVTPTSSSGAWQIVLLQDTGTLPRASSVFALQGNPAGTAQTVRLGVTPLAGATNTSLTVGVTETTPGTKVMPGLHTESIAVGSPPPTPETRVRPTLAGAAGDASIDGLNVKFTLKNGQANGGIQFRVHFTEAGTYDFDASLTNVNGWTLLPPSPPSAPIAANGDQAVNVQLVAGANATATDLIFVTTRGGDINVQYRIGLTVQ